MLRLIFVILIVILVIVAARRLVTFVRRPPEKSPARLVRCEHCGVYITEDAAITAGSRNYCTSQHRDRSSDT